MAQKQALAALTLMTALALSACGTGQTQEQSAPSATATVTATPTPSLDPASTLVATELAAPAVDTWVARGNIFYPSTAGIGPSATAAQGTPTGYEHSPAGALFASATYFGSFFNLDTFSATITDRMSAENVKEPFNNAYRTANEEVFASTGIDTANLRIAGYRLEEYTGNEARFTLAVGINDVTNRYITVSYPLIWMEDDWYIDAAGMVEVGADAIGQVESLENMVEWGSEPIAASPAATEEAGGAAEETTEENQ